MTPPGVDPYMWAALDPMAKASVLARRASSGMANGVGISSDEAAQRLFGQPHGDARVGELGVVPVRGGGYGTEYSLTVTDPRLNAGRPTNIPSLVSGQVNVSGLFDPHGPSDQQVDIAVDRAAQRQAMGQALPYFPTISEADAAAQKRHEDLAAMYGRAGDPQNWPLDPAVMRAIGVMR